VRARRGAAIVVVAALVAGAPGAARAQPAAPAEASDAYKQHMAAGAKLVEEENHAAARAEFEAAFQAAPRGSALVAAALCDKALFRYPQAIAAIERALRDHAATLEAGERKAAEAALAEMRAQLGFVQVVLVPAGATLRIDGEDQPPGGAQRTLPLAAGEHRLEARMKGYTPAAQMVTLAGGETAAIKLRLVPGDDRVPVDVRAPRRGLYVLGAVTVFFSLPPSEFSGAGAGVAAGARVGYRFASIAGAELGFSYAHVGVDGKGKPSFADTPEATYPLAYALSSFRFGAHARLMTTGERVRFVQTLGGGVMVDSVSWKPGAGGVARQDARGVDAFGESETGVEVDIRGGLVGLVLHQIVGSSGGLNHSMHDAYTGDTYGGPQYAIGIGLRGGYRLW